MLQDKYHTENYQEKQTLSLIPLRDLGRVRKSDVARTSVKSNSIELNQRNMQSAKIISVTVNSCVKFNPFVNCCFFAQNPSTA